MKDLSDYNVVFIKNDFKDELNKEINIKPPKVCPICGEKEVTNKIDVYNVNHKRFFKAWVCLKHSKLKEEPSIKPCLLIIGLIIILSIFLSILQIWWPFLLLIVFAYCFSNVYGRFYNIISLHIQLEYFKFESVIYAKNDEWSNEFLKLNESNSRKFTGDLTPYKAILSKIRRMTNALTIIVLMIPIPFLVGLLFEVLKVYSISIIFVYIFAILLFFGLMLSLFILLGLIFKNLNKTKKTKHDILFYSTKIV